MKETRDPQLRHARDVWKAEEENARRLGTRKALIIGFPLAFAAFSGSLDGPASMVSRGVRDDQVAAVLCLVFAGLVVGSLFGILAKALPIRKAGSKIPKLASGMLNPIQSAMGDYDETQKALTRFLSESDDRARWESVVLFLVASGELCDENKKLNARLHGALEWVFAALLFSVAAGFAYIWVVPIADTAYKGGASCLHHQGAESGSERPTDRGDKNGTGEG